ncbi:unnamed protein product, partial [Phaeothamnion confervicola]
ASVLLLAGIGPVAAQFPPPPGQTAQPGGPSPFPPPPGQGAPPAGGSPFPPPGAMQPQNTSVCESFVPLRQAAEKGAAAIKAAGERKASREEVCPLFKSFATSEAKMVKFIETYQTTCQVPREAVQQAKTNHARTVDVRNKVCAAGPAGGGPRAPSLSDAFG